MFFSAKLIPQSKKYVLDVSVVVVMDVCVSALSIPAVKTSICPSLTSTVSSAHDFVCWETLASYIKSHHCVSILQQHDVVHVCHVIALCEHPEILCSIV